MQALDLGSSVTRCISTNPGESHEPNELWTPPNMLARWIPTSFKMTKRPMVAFAGVGKP